MNSFNKLDELTEQGYLRKVEKDGLVLYNYTDKCTFEKKWNEYTLNARGTVYEKSTGKIVARAFPKFFNWEELPASEWRNLLKKSGYSIYDKVDGSLGIVYFYDGKWRVNTRGSFDSEQAVRATEMLQQKYEFSENIFTGITFLVEIIYPENRILLDYGDTEELRLLAAFNTEEGYEHTYHSLKAVSKITWLPLVKRYKMTIEEALERQSTMGADEEGFIVKYSDGYRVKIKSKEYLKVAKIMANATPLGCWEKFSAVNRGRVDVDFIEHLPEEFREEVLETVRVLEKQYFNVMCSIANDVIKVHNMSKKDIGLALKEGSLNLDHPAAVFNMRDGKLDKVDEYIRKVIRPTGNVLD